MADMGYGLTRDAVMHMVYVIVEKLQRSHSFTNEKAGRWWFQGFKSCCYTHATAFILLSGIVLQYGNN